MSMSSGEKSRCLRRLISAEDLLNEAWHIRPGDLNIEEARNKVRWALAALWSSCSVPERHSASICGVPGFKKALDLFTEDLLLRAEVNQSLVRDRIRDLLEEDE